MGKKKQVNEGFNGLKQVEHNCTKKKKSEA